VSSLSERRQLIGDKESASNLVYATSHGNLTILELGSNEVKRSMSQPPHLGPIASMCIDPNRTWLVTGTFNGTLCLWDIRFGQITQCAVDPTRGQGTWIMVAVNGCTAEIPSSQTFSIEVWDIEKPRLVETFVSEPENDSSARPENQSSPYPFTSCSATVNFEGGAAEAIAVLLQSRQKSKANADEQSMILESPFLHPEHEPPVFSHAISCFLAGVNFYGPGYIAGTEGLEIYIGADDFAMPSVTQDMGFLLTGSRDCRVRFWDLAQVERSRIICGTDIEDEKPSFR
jgi:phosphoinositide-3-kinase regulatory subunit 4